MSTGVKHPRLHSHMVAPLAPPPPQMVLVLDYQQLCSGHCYRSSVGLRHNNKLPLHPLFSTELLNFVFINAFHQPTQLLLSFNKLWDTVSTLSLIMTAGRPRMAKKSQDLKKIHCHTVLCYLQIVRSCFQACKQHSVMLGSFVSRDLDVKGPK